MHEQFMFLKDFDEFEIQPCKDFGECVEVVDEVDADFWSVYGRYKKETGKIGVDCLADFPNRKLAEYALLTFIAILTDFK